MAEIVDLRSNTRESAIGCWIWMGRRNADGYGVVSIHGYPYLAHRVAYEAVAAIPERLTLDHLCGVRACVRPEHLEPVTHAENVLRGHSPSADNARKTQCVHGHAFSPENVWTSKEGHRHCRTCNRLRARSRRAAERIAA